MIKIYTDGSCLENPGNGGWAAIINDDGNIKKISGSQIRKLLSEKKPIHKYLMNPKISKLLSKRSLIN